MDNTHLAISRAEVNFVYSCIPTINNENISFRKLFKSHSDAEKSEVDVILYRGFSIADKLQELKNYGDGDGKRMDVPEKLIAELRVFDDIKFKRHRPLCRKGISQYLSLDLDMGFIRPNIYLKDCTLHFNDPKYQDFEQSHKARATFDGYKNDRNTPNPNVRICIKPLVRIFPNGVSCSLKIELTSKHGESFEENEIHKIMHLVGTNQNCAGNYMFSIAPENARYSEEFAGGICNRDGVEIEGRDDTILFNDKEDQTFYEFRDGRYYFTLFNLYRLIINRMVETPIAAWFNYNGKNDQLDLLCRRYLIKKSVNPSASIFANKESQTPWVVTNIELEKNCYNEMTVHKSDGPDQVLGTQKSEHLRKFQHCINPLVYRTLDLDMEDFKFDPTYYHYSEWESDYLPIYSIHFDNRIFVQMSRRSILTLNQEGSISKNYPGSYFIPGLLDVCELIRVRWQTLLLLNYLSDKMIRKIRSYVSDVDWFRSEDSIAVSLEPIINQIDHLSTCLDSASSYVVSGDALREIQERLNDTFRLKELTSVVLKKADIVDRMRNLAIRKTLTDKE